MRGAAAWFALAERDALSRPFDVLLCSSYLALADLVALCPSLAALPKAVWFHENQWAYPVRDQRERDRHFGFTQLITAAVADLCLFNSAYNRDTFLAGCETAIRAMPDARPAGLVERIAGRSEVMPFPVEFPVDERVPRADLPRSGARSAGPRVLWNHRWEHDKDPDTLFEVLAELRREDVPFRLLVCGQRFETVPPVFDAARASLADRIEHFGSIEDRGRYAELLATAQIAVSTAKHEFFGVAMLEAADAGAFPLVPDRLVYPEHFPDGCRYVDAEDLKRRLVELCLDWTAGRLDLRADRRAWTRRFAASAVVPALIERLAELRVAHPDRA